MFGKRIIVCAALVAGSVGVATPAFASNTPATTAAATSPNTGTRCSDERDGSWPDWVQGKPDTFDAGATGGVYMWHDSDGWHLRVTHANNDQTVFTGALETTGAFVDVHGVLLEKNDSLHVSAARHVISFKFENYGHIDGVDFHTACAPSIVSSFWRGTHRVTVDRVFLGDHDTHPSTDPFRIRRAH